ncbi:phospholipase A [Sulfuriflexus sp.]|uniref:phospholipase A n=1 Tax=Sulfuriflexus sp. TaxID=2015443 RepID=UPI0028CFAF7F|nr:phospholipase A [Sulfuriflexus sp.]MDT8403432.1 phospholipase A [Sulfuriflexus sp.]
MPLFTESEPTGLMWHNNLKSSNWRAIQFNYTFPLNKRIRSYLQLFSGHGESLIDHDHYNNHISIGVTLIVWLWSGFDRHRNLHRDLLGLDQLAMTW